MCHKFEIFLICDTWVKPDRDKNRYVWAGVQIFSCLCLFSGSLQIGTPHIFLFHFPHFLVCGNVHNPNIRIVDVNRLRPFPVLLYPFMDYDFIYKGIKDFRREFVNLLLIFALAVLDHQFVFW